MNEKKYYINNIIHSILCMMFTGSVIQTFLFETGINEENVARFMAVMPVVQTVTILAFSAIVDRISNIVKTLAWCYLLAVPVSVYSVYLCFVQTGNVSTKYLFFIGFGILFYIGYAIYSVIAYKLPYVALDLSRYDRITGLSCVFGGIVTFGLSFVMTSFQARFGYFDVMSALMLLTALLIPVYFFVTLSIKPLSTDVKTAETKKQKVNLLTYKPFTVLIIPNLLRGFSYGIVMLSVTIGYYYGILDAKSASVLVVLTNIITVAANAVYPFLTRLLGDGGLILVSGIGMAVSLPFMLTGNNPVIFLVLYSTVTFFISFINSGVPVAVTKFVDYSVAGAYSGMRMMLHTLGNTIAGIVLIGMLKLFGGTATLMITGASQLVSSVVYYLYIKKVNKNKKGVKNQ